MIPNCIVVLSCILARYRICILKRSINLPSKDFHLLNLLRMDVRNSAFRHTYSFITLLVKTKLVINGSKKLL